MHAQFYPALCDSMDYSPPGSSVHGTLQARVLKRVATPFSGELPDARIEPGSPASQEDSSPLAKDHNNSGTVGYPLSGRYYEMWSRPGFYDLFNSQ